MGWEPPFAESERVLFVFLFLSFESLVELLFQHALPHDPPRARSSVVPRLADVETGEGE